LPRFGFIMQFFRLITLHYAGCLVPS
jgi:hypothetical protein